MNADSYLVPSHTTAQWHASFVIVVVAIPRGQAWWSSFFWFISGLLGGVWVQSWLWKFFSIQDRWFGSDFGCCFSFHFLLVSSILHNLLDSKVAVRCLLLSPFSNRWKPWSFILPQNENTCVCLFNMYLMLHFTNRPTDLGGKETKTVEAGGSSSAFTVVEFKVTLSIWSTVEVFLVGHS